MAKNSLTLSKIEQKVLSELSKDARKGISILARDLNITYDKVRNCIKNLEKKNVVIGYTTLLNIPKLGYLTYKVLLQFRSTSPELEREIINYLTSITDVAYVSSCDGQYNLSIVVRANSSHDFRLFFKNLMHKYAQYFERRNVFLVMESHTCPKTYLFGEKSNFIETFYGDRPECVIDALDEKILKSLSKNARTSLKDLVSNLGITPEAGAVRIKKLGKKGVILAFIPVINFWGLGYERYSVYIKLRKFDNIEKMFYFFKTHPNIVKYITLIGEYDIGLEIETSNSSHLREIVQSMRHLFTDDIETYNSNIIYRHHKYSTLDIPHEVPI